MNDKKRSLSLNSTASDLETSVVSSPKRDAEKEEKKQKKQDKKKIKTSDTMSNIAQLERKMDEKSTKLSEMLTKKDKPFIKQILVDTLDEMKDKIIESVLHRVEILENEIHELATEQTNQKKEIQAIKKENEALKEDNKKLLNKIGKEEDNRKFALNDLEQYSRRNNIRIYGLNFDNKFESSQETAEGIASLLNEKMDLNISGYDIDIAHRLGKFEENKIRPVIVKFVQRQVKITVMRNTKKLKGTDLSINDDLTQLNQKVLSSVRLKAKDKVEKGWSYEGKIYAKYKSGKTGIIEKEDYAKWLSLPWPKEVNK